MGSDDLFARTERAIIDNRLLRDERRILEREIAKARCALRTAVREMADLRAVIEAGRRRGAASGDEPELPVETERLQCMKTYVQSQQDVLRTLRNRTAN
jgi:hypothetical protein